MSLEVTACIPTRGDVDLDPVLELLPPEWPVIVWGPDHDEAAGIYGTLGRYAAVRYATTPLVYFQDDDCLFEHHDELLDAYQPGRLVAVYGHGENPDGYDDMALVHGGAIVGRELPLRALDRYLERWPADEGFHREADMIAGTLTPHLHVNLPYTIRLEIATRPNRMANQPWQKALKLEVTNRARAIRDEAA